MLQNIFAGIKYYNIEMVVIIAINCVISIIKGLHEISTVGKKPHGNNSNMKIQMGTMESLGPDIQIRAKSQIYWSYLKIIKNRRSITLMEF